MSSNPIKDQFYYSVSEYERRKNPKITDKEVLAKSIEYRQKPEAFHAKAYKELTGKNIDVKTLKRISEFDGIDYDPNKLDPTTINFVPNDKRDLIQKEKEVTAMSMGIQLSLDATDKDYDEYYNKHVYNPGRMGDTDPMYETTKKDQWKQKEKLKVETYKQKKAELDKIASATTPEVIPVSDFLDDTRKITQKEKKQTGPYNSIRDGMKMPTTKDVWAGNDLKEERQNAKLDSESYIKVLDYKIKNQYEKVKDPIEKAILDKYMKGEQPQMPKDFKPSPEFNSFLDVVEVRQEQYKVNATQFGSMVDSKPLTYADQLSKYRQKDVIRKEKYQKTFTEANTGEDDVKGRLIPSQTRSWVNAAVIKMKEGVDVVFDAFGESDLEAQANEARKNGDKAKYERIQRKLALDDFNKDVNTVYKTQVGSDKTAPIWEATVNVDGVVIGLDHGKRVTRVVAPDGKSVHVLSNAQQKAVEKYEANPKLYKPEENFSPSAWSSLKNAGGQTSIEMLPMIVGGMVTAPLRGMGIVGKVASNVVPTSAMFIPQYGSYFKEEFEKTGDWSRSSSYAAAMAGTESLAEWFGGAVESRFARRMAGVTPDIIRGAGQRAALSLAGQNAANLANFSFAKQFAKELMKDVGQEEAEELLTMVAQTGIDNIYGKDASFDFNEFLTTVLVTPFATLPLSAMTNISNYKKPGVYRDMLLAAASDVETTKLAMAEMVTNGVISEKQQIEKMKAVYDVSSVMDKYADMAKKANVKTFTPEEKELMDYYTFHEAIEKKDYTKKVEQLLLNAASRNLDEAVNETVDPIIPVFSVTDEELKFDEEVVVDDEKKDEVVFVLPPLVPSVKEEKSPEVSPEIVDDDPSFTTNKSIGPDGDYITITNDKDLKSGEYSIIYGTENGSEEILAQEAKSIASKQGIPIRIDYAVNGKNDTNERMVIHFRNENDAKLFHDYTVDSEYFAENQTVDHGDFATNKRGHEVGRNAQFVVGDLKDINQAASVVNNSVQTEDGNYEYELNGLIVPVSKEDYDSYVELIQRANKIWNNATGRTDSGTATETNEAEGVTGTAANNNGNIAPDQPGNRRKIQTRVTENGQEKLVVGASNENTKLGSYLQYKDGEKSRIRVNRGDERGFLSVDEGGKVEYDNGNTVTEIGNISNNKDKSLKDLGFSPGEDIKDKKNGEIVIGGRTFVNRYSSVDGAVTMEDGVVVSVELEEKITQGGYNGKQVSEKFVPVTFNGEDAQDIAAILLENDLINDIDTKNMFESYPVPEDIQPNVAVPVTLESLTFDLMPFFPGKPLQAATTAKLYFAMAQRMVANFPNQYKTPNDFLKEKIALLNKENSLSEFYDLREYIKGVIENSKQVVSSLPAEEQAKMMMYIANMAKTLSALEDIDISKLPQIRTMKPKDRAIMIVKEIMNKTLTTVTGGKMAMSKAAFGSGVFISTRPKNPDSRKGYVYSVKVNISNPFHLGDKNKTIESLQNEVLAAAINNYIQKNNVAKDRVEFLRSARNMKDPILSAYPGVNVEVGLELSKTMSEKGYDSIYDPATGYVVVFDPNNVTYTETVQTGKLKEKKKLEKKQKGRHNAVVSMAEKLFEQTGDYMLLGIMEVLAGGWNRYSVQETGLYRIKDDFEPGRGSFVTMGKKEYDLLRGLGIFTPLGKGKRDSKGKTIEGVAESWSESTDYPWITDLSRVRMAIVDAFGFVEKDAMVRYVQDAYDRYKKNFPVDENVREIFENDPDVFSPEWMAKQDNEFVNIIERELAEMEEVKEKLSDDINLVDEMEFTQEEIEMYNQLIAPFIDENGDINIFEAARELAEGMPSEEYKKLEEYLFYDIENKTNEERRIIKGQYQQYDTGTEGKNGSQDITLGESFEIEKPAGAVNKKKESVDAILDSLPDDVLFITHVTPNGNAENIYNSNLRMPSGVSSTTGIVNKEQLRKLLYDLIDGNSPHRGYLDLFIGSIDRNTLESQSGTSLQDKLENYLDDNFIDDVANTQLPKELNFGYFTDGVLTIPSIAEVENDETKPTIVDEQERVAKLAELQKTKSDLEKAIAAQEKRLSTLRSNFDNNRIEAAPPQGTLFNDQAQQVGMFDNDAEMQAQILKVEEGKLADLKKQLADVISKINSMPGKNQQVIDLPPVEPQEPGMIRFIDLKVGDIVVVMDSKGEIGRGVVTEKMGNEHVVLNGDQTKKFNYTNSFKTLEKEVQPEEKSADANLQEKVYGLLEAVNMDRKDPYELQPIQPITIGNRTFYLLEAKNKAGDSVFNVVDEKGNIPKDFEANWRNFSNAMDGLNSLKSESSPLPNLNSIKNKLDNEILRQVTIKKSIKSIQKTLKKLNENLANAAIEDKNTIQNQINTLAKRLDEYSKFNEDLNESILSLRRELDRAVNLVNNSKPDSYNVGDVVTIKTRNGDYAQAEIIPHDHLDVAVVEQNGMFYTVEISTLSLLGEPGLTKQEALSNIAPTVYTRGAAILDKIVTERMSILAKPFLNHSPKIEKAIQEETNKYDNLPFLYSEAQRNKLRELVPMAKAANYLDYLNEIIDTKDRSLLPGVSPGTAKNFQDLKTEERFNFTYNNTRENIIARNKRNSSNEYMDKQIPLPLELRGEPVTNTLRDFVNTSFNSDRDLDLKQKAPELYAKVERLYELYKSIRNEYGYLPLEFEDISNSLYALSHAVFQKAPENREIAENKINTAYDKYFPGEIDINENAPQTEQEIKDELKDLITQMRNVKGVDALKELNRKINEANTKLKDIKGARENKPPTQPDIPAGPPVNKDVDKIAKDRKAAIKQDIEADGKRLMELMAKRKDIRNRGMGIIPTDEEESEVNFELMQIGYKMVANYIKLGIVEFSDMVREAANTFGELTQDFLDTFKQIYVSQKIMRKELTTTFDQVENFKLSDIPANEEQSYADFINELFDENRDNPDNLFKSVISAYISQEEYSFRTIFDALYSIRKNDMIDMFNDFVYVYNMIKLENEDVGPLMDDVNLEEYEHLFEKKENPKQKFIDTIYERLSLSEPNLNIVKIRDIANSVNLPYQFDTELQEYVEVAIIRHAKEISDHPGYTQAEKFDLILDLYKKQPTITQRTSTRIAEQQYSTPIPMGFLAGEFVNVIAPRAVLEPSAGNGMMVINVPSSKITVNERDPVRLSNLVDMGFKKVTGYDAELPFDGKYEAVVMNPPFNNAPAKKYGEYTIDRLDHQMVINALDSMSNNGRAAIIIGGNTQYKESGILSNKDYAFLSYLYENYNVSDVINMDGSLYYKQGTSYETRMILIDGRRTDKTEKKYAPVQKDAKAEVIKDYKTLLERVNSVKDEILSDQTGTNINNGSGSNGLSGSGSGQGPNGGQGQGSNSGGAGKSGGSRGGRNGSNQPGLSPGEQDGGLNGNNGIGPDAGTPNGDGGQGDANGNGNEGDGIVDGNDNLQLPDRTDLKGVVDEKVNYKPRSRANPMLTKIPVNMVGAIEEQLDQFDDIDAFVQQKLQYLTKADLFKALDAEQIDAVALAIVQIERGSSFINGDMTGLGKGRTAAAIIRYAILQGKKPIFLTESDNLLSDIYRDMKAIGNGKNKPFIINSAAKASMTEEDDDGNIVVVHRALDTEEKEQYYIKGTLPPGTDYIAGTYSQFAGKEIPIYNKNGVQTNKGSLRRKPWLRDMARDNIFIFDESHNMGGSGSGNKTSNINQFFMEIIPETKGGMFLSATFSKRPNTMPIYAIKTDMSMAMMSQQDLINAIITGGTPLQEVMSRQLVESGQMIRRDRDFDDVEIEWKDMVSTKDQDEKTYDQIIELFNDIIKFQREFIRPIIDGMNEEGAGQQGEVSLGGRADLGVSNTPFASRAFNSTRQLLMAIKAKEIANEAIKEIQAGRKPVIAVSNTMESFLKDMGYVKGETIENTDFSMVLMRGLRSVMRYNILRGGVAVDYEDISYDDLTPEGKRMYDQIVNAINTTSSGISASPIDIVLQTIRDAGYKIDELTGRDTTIIYDKKGNPTIDTGRDKNKKRMVSQFNSGELDALIINQSGATGLSLHSSRDFKDQKQRVMLFLQMQLDINKEVQIRGRIDRFGQILRGAFRYFVSMIPAEKRLVMMFKSKLKSLDANTKASQKDKANDINLVDFLNKHGDEMATDWLKDNFDDFNEKMLDPLGMAELTVEQRATFSPPENAASKLTSKVALLSVAEQNRFYDEVTERYVAHIQYLNDNNSNDLEMKILPFNAETLSRTVIVAGTDPTNPFAGDSVLEEIEVDVLKKQMSLKEIDEYIAKQIKPLEERIDAVDDADIAKDEEVAVVETNKALEYVLNKFRSKLRGLDLMSDGYLSSRERTKFEKELDKLKDKAYKNGTYKLIDLNGEEIQSELIDPRERFKEANYFEADGNTILNRTEYYDDIIYFTSKTGEKVRLGKPNFRGVTSVDFTKKPEYQEEDGATSDRSLLAYNNVVIDDLQKYHNNHIMKEAAKAAENTRKRLPIFMDRLMNSLNTRGITDSGIIGEAMRKAQEDFKNENDIKWESFKERNLAINQNTAGYLSMFKLKKVYMVPTTANISAETSTTEALFIGFRYNKDNMTPSGIKAVFATRDSRRRIEIPLSKRAFINASLTGSNRMFKVDPANWDSKTSNVIRKKAYVITGNLLQAFSVNRNGMLASFTTKDGQIRQGIVMPDNYDVKSQKTRVRISTMIDKLRAEGSLQDSTGDILIKREAVGWSIEVPKSQVKGAKYFNHPELRALTNGNNFRTLGKVMMATVPESRIQDLLNKLSELYNTSVSVDPEKSERGGNQRFSRKGKNEPTITQEGDKFDFEFEGATATVFYNGGSYTEGQRKKEAYIEIINRPNTSQKGTGKRLLDFIKDHFKEEGAEILTLRVDNGLGFDGSGANPLFEYYANQGFKQSFPNDPDMSQALEYNLERHADLEQFRIDAPVQSDYEVIDGFYSPIEKRLAETRITRQTPAKWLALVGSGDESVWTGLKSWLEEKGPQEQVSKAEIYRFFKNNRVKIKVVEKSDGEINQAVEEANAEIARANEKMMAISREMGGDGSKPYLDIDTKNPGWYFTPKGGLTGVLMSKYKRWPVPEERIEELEALQETVDNYQNFLDSREDMSDYLENPPQYKTYTLPGEKENYKETLVLFPNKQKPMSFEKFLSENTNLTEEEARDWYDKNIERFNNEIEYGSVLLYKHNHWKEGNVILHTRHDIRKDIDGNKVLMVEEFQSDWAENGRKIGFKPEVDLYRKGQDSFKKWQYENPGVNPSVWREQNPELAGLTPPSSSLINTGPFVTKTSAWVKLGWRMMLREAVAQGATKIAWTTGQQQVDRFDLSSQIDYISTDITPTGKYINISPSTGMITVKVDDSGIINYQSGSTSFGDFMGKPLSDVIGVELAAKIINSPDGTRLEGIDLKIGGEGMKAFYGDPVTGNIGFVGQVAKSLFKQEPKTTNIGVYSDKEQMAMEFIEEYKQVNDTKKVKYWEDRLAKLESKNKTIQHSIDITPELIRMVDGGISLFSKMSDDRESITSIPIPAGFTIIPQEEDWVSIADQNGNEGYMMSKDEALKQIKDKFPVGTPEMSDPTVTDLFRFFYDLSLKQIGSILQWNDPNGEYADWINSETYDVQRNNLTNDYAQAREILKSRINDWFNEGADLELTGLYVPADGNGDSTNLFDVNEDQYDRVIQELIDSGEIETIDPETKEPCNSYSYQ